MSAPAAASGLVCGVTIGSVVDVDVDAGLGGAGSGEGATDAGGNAALGGVPQAPPSARPNKTVSPCANRAEEPGDRLSPVRARTVGLAWRMGTEACSGEVAPR